MPPMVSGSYRLSVAKSVNEATRSGRSCRICSWYARRPMLKPPPVSYSTSRLIPCSVVPSGIRMCGRVSDTWSSLGSRRCARPVAMMGNINDPQWPHVVEEQGHKVLLQARM
eukprot:scaffold61949_cov66-Attheya_sp.AAC.3